MESQMLFEVSADWMKACGKGNEAKRFRVIRTWDAGLLAFAELDDNGHPWTVNTEWRGKFV